MFWTSRTSPFAAPNLEQRIVGGARRVGRIEQQHAAEPRAPAGRQRPVLALDVVDDRRARPGQQRRHDQADALAAAGRREAQHMLRTVVAQIVARPACPSTTPSGPSRPARAIFAGVGPARGAIGLGVLRLAGAPDRHGDGDGDGGECRPMRRCRRPRRRCAAHRRRRRTTTRRRPAADRPAQPSDVEPRPARAGAGRRAARPSIGSRPRSPASTTRRRRAIWPQRILVADIEALLEARTKTMKDVGAITSSPS